MYFIAENMNSKVLPGEEMVELRPAAGRGVDLHYNVETFARILHT